MITLSLYQMSLSVHNIYGGGQEFFSIDKFQVKFGLFIWKTNLTVRVKLWGK